MMIVVSLKTVRRKEVLNMEEKTFKNLKIYPEVEVSDTLIKWLDDNPYAVINDRLLSRISREVSKEDYNTFEELFDEVSDSCCSISFDEEVEIIQEHAVVYAEEGDFEALEELLNDYKWTLSKNGYGSRFDGQSDYTDTALTTYDITEYFKNIN